MNEIKKTATLIAIVGSPLKYNNTKLKPEELECTEEEYQEFLNTFFTNLDYEDRHDTVTIKTSSKFRLMAGFIDVLTTFGPLRDDMKKCKKYCAFKAVDIFKALKRGEVPKRGGPKEEENTKENTGDKTTNNNGNNSMETKNKTSKNEYVDEKTKTKTTENKEKIMLVCVARKSEIHKIVEIVEEADKQAFMWIGDAREVMGEGFKEINGE